MARSRHVAQFATFTFLVVMASVSHAQLTFAVPVPVPVYPPAIGATPLPGANWSWRGRLRARHQAHMGMAGRMGWPTLDLTLQFPSSLGASDARRFGAPSPGASSAPPAPPSRPLPSAVAPPPPRPVPQPAPQFNSAPELPAPPLPEELPPVPPQATGNGPRSF